MKKLSKPLMLGALGMLTMLTMTGCFGERPVEVQPNPKPTSETQKSVKVSEPKKIETGKEYQTGWTQLEDSIEVSISSADNCLPQVEKAVRDGKTVSFWLKDAADDCSQTKVITYFAIDDAKDIEKVQMYEAGYKIPSQMYELDQK